jgi:DNA primase
MDSAEFLTHFDHVRRTGQGYMVRCKAHADLSPSLSVREGKRGLLLHCFAGCSVQDICKAMGLTVKDLFYDSIVDFWEAKQQRAQREHERQGRAKADEATGRTIDAQREADYLLASARNIDISGWSNARLDRELNRLADAYALVENGVIHGG